MSHEHQGGWGGSERRQQHPSPRGRRTLKWGIIAGALSGFAILMYLNVLLQRVIDRTQPPSAHDAAGLAVWLRIMSVTMGLSILGVAAWIAHFSWRVARSGVFPPPGSRHLAPRRIVRGREARAFAHVGYALAALLGMAGLALIPLVWKLLRTLSGP
jgi:hypothetical protein